MSARRIHRRIVCALAAVAVAALAPACTPADPSPERQSAPGAPEHPGPERWSTVLGDWPFTMTADDHGAFVIVGEDLLALDPVDGRERWRTPVGLTILYDPAIDHDTVVVSARERFVALDRLTGAPRWEVSVGEAPSTATLTSTAEGPLALLPTEQGSVLAVDSASGTTRWSTRFPGRIYGPPAVSGELAAITWHDTDEPKLRVLDLATGSVVWDATIGVASSAPVVAGDVVVTGEGDGHYHARVVGRDVATGIERWSVAVPASFASSLLPGSGGVDVALTDQFGTVTMIDARSGHVRWQRQLDLPVLTTRVFVTPSTVVLGTFGGRVPVLDRDTGRELSRDHPGGFPSGMGIARGRLLLALRLTDPPRVVARPLR